MAATHTSPAAPRLLLSTCVPLPRFNLLGFDKASPLKCECDADGEKQRPSDKITESECSDGISLSTTQRLTQAGSRVWRRTPAP